MKLRNIKQIPFEIAHEIARNNRIVRLLYIDQPSALQILNEISLTSTELIEQNYIGFYPATEVGINQIDRNTFIIINLEDISLYTVDNNISASGCIYITTDKAHCLLNENKLRLLELLDEIDTTLDGKKLLSAGKITLTSMNYVVFSDFRCGYRINFRVNDQSNRKAEL